MSFPSFVFGPTSCDFCLFISSRPRRCSPIAAMGRGVEQDHYAVLGVNRSASTADVKRAYRVLARKYHPDVSNNTQAGEIFKTINYAYQVLSDEVSRAQYDLRVESFEAGEGTLRHTWTNNTEYDEWQRMYQSAELRQRMRHEKAKRRYSWYRRRTSSQEYDQHEKRPFSEILRFAITLFFTQIVGYRASLALCSIMALLDRQLDFGYKMGYILAWFLGGRGGILLSLFIFFTSWFCGKNSSHLVALVVLAIWLAANLARFAPLPQGAILALVYMSIKLQDDSN